MVPAFKDGACREESQSCLAKSKTRSGKGVCYVERLHLGFSVGTAKLRSSCKRNPGQVKRSRSHAERSRSHVERSRHVSEVVVMSSGAVVMSSEVVVMSSGVVVMSSGVETHTLPFRRNQGA